MSNYSNEVVLFKLQTGYYFITLEDHGTRLRPALKSIYNTGFGRFSLEYFRKLIKKGYIIYSHTCEYGDVYLITDKFCMDYDIERRKPTIKEYKDSDW